MLIVTDVAFLVVHDNVMVVAAVQVTWLGAENEEMDVAVLPDPPPPDDPPPDEPPPDEPPPDELPLVVVEVVELLLLPPPHAANPTLSAATMVTAVPIPAFRMPPGWTLSTARARNDGQMRR
jgi:hypothetical protein